MRPVHCAALLSAALALPVLAKLPPASDEAKADAAETAAKAAWADKVDAYKLCLVAGSGGRRLSQERQGGGPGVAPAPAAMPGCTDPGPYLAVTPAASKPLEAAGAHSPPGTATSPPSTNAPRRRPAAEEVAPCAIAAAGRHRPRRCVQSQDRILPSD